MASNAVRTGMLALAVLCALPAGRSPLAAVDAARARYGDADAAREDNEPSAVLALLQGMSLVEAAEAMDDAAFARAEAEGTAAAYAGYRSSYPEGRHVEEAERRERERTPGRRFRDCPECPEMVAAPEGSFLMGSTSGDDDERPVHEVTIARPFAVGVYEVTFAEWDACVSDGGCGGYRPGNTVEGRGVRPVINVGWEDAQGYVRWLSRKTGKAYRLPSESEWEYVARAGTTGPYHFGSSLSSSQANYGGIGEVRFRSGAIRRMRSGCTTCTGTYGSGWRTAGTTATTGRRRTGARGSLGIVAGGCCAAAPGSAIPGLSARPRASGASPATGTATSGFALPARSHLDSLRLYLGGPGSAEPPGRFFRGFSPRLSRRQDRDADEPAAVPERGSPAHCAFR